MLVPEETSVVMKCSRAGCEQRAQWQIRWRNPKIHSTDRVKIWLACGEHVEYLREFLLARNFPVEVVETDESGVEEHR